MVSAFFKSLNETSVHLEQSFGIELVDFSLWIGDSELLFLGEPHVSHVVLREVREEICPAKSEIRVFLNVFNREMLGNVVLLFVVEFVEAGLRFGELVERLVSVLTHESPGQRQAIVVILDVGLLLLQQAEFVSEPKGLDEFVLGPLLSLLKRVFVESEEVVKEVNIESLDLLVEHDVLREGIIVLVDCVKGVADAHQLMLHGEEAVSDHVETVSLDDRPFLDQLWLGRDNI